MTASTVTKRGRARAEARMSDTCRVTADGDAQPIYDPETDTYTYPDSTTVYEGECQVRPADLQDLEAEAGVHMYATRGYVVKLPVVAGQDVRRNHTVEVLTSLLDPALPGTKMRVLGALKGSHITSRRLACEETTA